MGKKKVKELIPDILSILFLILPFVCLFLPAATYKYKKKIYALKILSMLQNKEIAGGKVTITPNPALWIILGLSVVTIVLIVLAVFVLKNVKLKKIIAEVEALVAIAGIVIAIVLAVNMTTTLDGAKSVTVSYGLYFMAACYVIPLIFALKKLTDHKVLCALDFMILPGMLYLVINNYIPMAGLYIAFKKIDYSVGLWNSPWVGWKNFISLFSTDSTLIITRNTILYNFAFIVLGLLSGIIVGICLSEIARKFLQKTYQTVILLPQLISYVIVAYIVYAFLSESTGLINQGILGGNNTIQFYSDTRWWPFILIFINIWKQLGYNAIVFLSSIVGIDRGLYEAARVDGATKWEQIIYVTIPQLKPTIITLFLLQCGRIFYSDFGLFYQVPLNQGALYNVTDTIDTFVYRALMVNNNIGIASAASAYQAVVGFALVLTVNLIVKKIDKESAMF